MNEPVEGTEQPGPPRHATRPVTPKLVIGKWTVEGPAAPIIALTLLALIVTLIVWSRPSVAMLIAGALWLGFIVYWNVTAGHHPPGESKETTEQRSRRQLMLNLGLVLLFVSIPGLRWPFLPPDAWHVPVGLAVMAVGTLLHVWARMHLGRNWSSEVMIVQGHRLVTSGPYRLVRHPVYTAIGMLTIGTALVSARVLSLVGAALFVSAYVIKLRAEERALGEEFGAEWKAYRERSWAMLPPVY